MTSSRVIEARGRAELAEALQRREDLQHRWAVATYTASGGLRPEDLDVELAQVDALIAELEERLASAAIAIPLPSLAANDTAQVPSAEYAGTREAAALLGISARTLEGLRARGEGPPCIRIGRRVLYPIAALRAHGK